MLPHAIRAGGYGAARRALERGCGRRPGLAGHLRRFPLGRRLADSRLSRGTGGRLARRRIILATRSRESWYDRIAETILAVLTASGKRCAEQRDWLAMFRHVDIERSLGGRTDRTDAMAAFEAHEAAVRALVPEDNLLVFAAADGWAPLCDFLGSPVPDVPYPRSNSRDEFFALLGGEA